MSPRDKYTNNLKAAIHANERIINLHGERGVGKSYIISQFKKALAEEQKRDNSIQYLCGTFDFNNYAGLSQDMMIDALYDLCDFLVAKKTIALYHFNIVDRIDSSRNNRIPYSERKILNGFDTSSAISEFVSDFVELPYIGAGIKIAKFTAKLAMKYRPKSEEEIELYEQYKNLSDDEIKEKLPASLATDIKQSMGSQQKNIRLLIIIDNYNNTTLNNENAEWLNKLITDTDNSICWIFVSRERIQSSNIHIHEIPIELMSTEEIEYLLKSEKNLTDENEINSCMKLCNGNPLHVERILEFIAQQRSRGSLDWSALKKYSYEHIALETLKGLSTEQKEMLFQLNFANTFDEELFCCLFPGKLFSIYQTWFHSSLFTQNDNGTYCVQNSMKEEISTYMNHIDKTLTSECYYNLFKAEQNWFKRQEGFSDATITDIGQHMQSLMHYGRNIKSIREYFECLIEIKNILIPAGYTNNYLDELKQIATRSDDYIKTTALKEIATLSLYCSNYSDARDAIAEGINLSKRTNDISSELEFASIRMNLEYIAPADASNAVTGCIDIAKEYIKTLENNIQTIPYKTYISNMVKVNLYLSKEYIIQKDYDNAEACLNYIFNVCNDPAKLNVLSLYFSLAKAQEHMGELYAERKDRFQSIELYKKAVDTYQVAEILQPFWDSSFYLNFGLVHKRMAEEYFNLANEDTGHSESHIQNALNHLDIALSKYKQVKERVPEMIDAYCKMGFAYVTAADKLWKDNKWNQKVEAYLTDASTILDQAIEQITSNAGGKTDGNRQIANSRCIISRISALYHERRGHNSIAEDFFKQTLKDGDYAIQAAPNHPYGYMEAANGYLTYSSFLMNQNRKAEATRLITTGLDILTKAESFINDSIGFQDIRKNLELNLMKCK